MKYLIGGLGNIGAEYELTRHNVGFLVVDYLADKNNVTFQQGKSAFFAEFKYKGRTLILLKPTTYMNLSGKAINFWLQDQKIPLENLLVITDDIALPFGKLRLRPKGSNGGHNGLGNIQEVLGTEQYSRLRIGIGSEFSKGRQVDFVLGNFSPEQMKDMPFLLSSAGDAVLNFVTIGVERTMNEVNKK